MSLLYSWDSDGFRHKGQGTRLMDVFALGPFMVWFAIGAKNMPNWSRWLMGVSGTGTIIYNLYNYIYNEDIESNQEVS